MSTSEAAAADLPASLPVEASAPAPAARPWIDAAVRVALLSAAAPLAFMLALELLVSLGFFVGITVTPLHLPLAVVLGLAASVEVARRLFGWRRGLTVLAAVLVVEVAFTVSAVLVSGAVYDVSYDGQAYQQEGVIRLAQGWNPLSGDERLGKNSLWVAHYAKGPWMLASSLYRLTGHIEQAKAFSIVLMLVAFAMSLALLLSILPRAPGSAFALALLVALNPVALAQATSFYVDGQSASLLTVMLVSVCLLLSRRFGDTVPLAILAAATVLLVNVKATGLAYALVLLLGSILFLLLGQTRMSSRVIIVVFGLSVLVGAVVVGYSPYVTNTLDHGTPLYPLTGSLDILTPNTPHNLVGQNRVVKLFLATFAKARNPYGTVNTELKSPLQVDSDEIEVFGAPDVRASGFGPLFAAIALFTVFLVFLNRFWPDETGDDGPERKAIVLSVLILVSSLATADGWWARYAPQIWLLPAIAIAIALRRGWRAPAIAARALCLVLAADIALVGYGSITHHIESTADLHEALTELAGGGPYRVQFGAFESNRIRLEEGGVTFTVVPSLPDVQGRYFPHSEAVVYPPPD